MNFVHFAEPSWAGRCYEAKNQIKDQAEGSTALAPSEKVLKVEDVVPTSLFYQGELCLPSE